jgi:hypothetical protein
MSNSGGGAGVGGVVQIRYGTGVTGPSNGAGLTGVAVGHQGILLEGSTNPGMRVPFLCCAVITGLTLGTQIWLDVMIAANTSGTFTISTVEVSAFELP